MTIRGRSALILALLTCSLATPAFAGLSPYARLDYGGNQLRMSEGNDLIARSEASLKAMGYPASFEKVGSGYGPSGALGLWLFPGLRVGATYSYLRSVRKNRLHVPGYVFFADDLDFRMTEIGGEVALRIVRLGGLTLGGNLSQGRARFIEGYSYEDYYGQYYQDDTGRRTITTYGGYVGFDQTNESGVAGFVRLGYQRRDVGRLPSDFVISDGTTSVQTTGETIPLDYSGLYLKIGVGFDLRR